MKKPQTNARSPKKLAINKEKLRVLSHDQLANVDGGSPTPPPPPTAIIY